LEKAILSEGMLVPYSQEALHKQSLLNQIVYGGSSKIYSQANHIDSVLNVSNNQYYNILQNMITNYSYKDKGSNKVKGLAGGGV
jgi:hypothetical protein